MMTNHPTLPARSELIRTTPEFDEHSAPASLLDNHQVDAGRWARLIVTEGSLEFVFEDRPDEPHPVAAGELFEIPPQQAHRVSLTGPARFFVELYRTPSHPT